MRFLISSAVHPPDRGGAAHYTSQPARSLAQLGHEVGVLTSKRHAGTQPRPNDEDGPGVHVRRAVTAWNGKGMLDACAAVSRFRPDAAIFQYVRQMYGRGGVAFAAAAIPLLLRRTSGTRVLGMLRELAVPWSRRPARMVQTSAHRLQVTLLVLGCRCLVVTNLRYARLARAWAPPRTDVRLIPLGPNIVPPVEGAQRSDAQSGDTQGDDTPTREPAPQRPGLLGDFCRLTIGKRPLALVATLERLERTRLLLLGSTDGDRSSEAEFANAVARAGLAKRLTWSGFLASPELSNRLSSLDVYLHTQGAGASRRSTTLAASLAQGLPVVAYRGAEALDWLVYGETCCLLRKAPQTRSSKRCGACFAPGRWTIACD